MFWKKKDSPRTTVDGAAKSRKQRDDAPHADNLQEYLDGVYGTPDYHTTNYIHTAPVTEIKGRGQILLHMGKHYVDTRQEDAGRVHVGAAGFFNFDIVAKGKHDALVLVDINAQQMAFWRGDGTHEGMLAMIRDCPTLEALHDTYKDPAQCKKYLDGAWKLFTSKSRLTPEWAHAQRTIATTNWDDFVGDSQWAKNAEDYAFIHALVRDGKSAAVPLDIFNKKDCTKLAESITHWHPPTSSSQGYKVDSVYASNILDFVGEQWNELNLRDALLRCHVAGYQNMDNPEKALADATEALLVEMERVKTPRGQPPSLEIRAKGAPIAQQMASAALQAFRAGGCFVSPNEKPITNVNDIDAYVITRFKNSLSRQMSHESMEYAGITKEQLHDFTGRPQHKTYEGLDALAGKNGSIYICKTDSHADLTLRVGGQMQDVSALRG